MSSTRIVGDLKTSESKRGFLYEMVYYVLDADKATYTPYYKEPGNTAPFGFPAGTYIYEWEDEPWADHWLITIKACNDGYDWGDSSDNAGDDVTKVLRTVGKAQIYLDPEWWGARTADADDRSDSLLRFARGTIIEAVCDVGDLIFKNAIDDVGKLGSADYTDSPFTAATMAAVDLKWIGKTVDTETMSFRMYRAGTTAMEHYIGFYGTNNGAAGQFTPPAGCSPTGYTDAGIWLAQGQEIEEYAKYYGGIWYFRVDRKILKSPGSLRWDPDKNRGYWTW